MSRFDADWRVHRTWNPLRDGDDVVIVANRTGIDPRPVIVGISTGPAELRDIDPMSSDPGPIALWFPPGVVDAIAETVKPGPSQGEIRRLEEALAIERARVDKALEAAAALPYSEQAAPDIDPELARSAGRMAADYALRLERQLDRAADLRTGLSLALTAAANLYTEHHELADPERDRRLAILVEIIKGTLERDDRLGRREPGGV